MATQSNALTVEDVAYEIDISQLVTEDDEPVDNIFSEKQQRLLVDSLYASWAGPGEGRTFYAAANIGVFYMPRNPAIVPDVLLSLDVEAREEIEEKRNRSYFIWEFGKPPDVAIEIVSNKVGEELGTKLNKYSRLRVAYYVVFDPLHQLGEEALSVYRLQGYNYHPHESLFLSDLGLGLTLWAGEFADLHRTWLRWVDQQGNLLLTGIESREQERLAKEAAIESREQERLAKEVALERAAKLAAALRQLGHDPDQL
jgi:Uma2 family endonuclease